VKFAIKNWKQQEIKRKNFKEQLKISSGLSGGVNPIAQIFRKESTNIKLFNPNFRNK